jgi:uncharacterized protein (UPF0333 family)
MKERNERKSSKFGGGILEYSLMVGGILVVLITVFFPYIEGLNDNISKDVNAWYDNEQEEIFE